MRINYKNPLIFKYYTFVTLNYIWSMSILVISILVAVFILLIIFFAYLMRNNWRINLNLNNYSSMYDTMGSSSDEKMVPLLRIKHGIEDFERTRELMHQSFPTLYNTIPYKEDSSATITGIKMAKESGTTMKLYISSEMPEIPDSERTKRKRKKKKNVKKVRMSRSYYLYKVNE